MPSLIDGPSSSLFSPVIFDGNISAADLKEAGLSERMTESLDNAPAGSCVCWGIPFECKDPILIQNEDITLDMEPVSANWLVFMHTTDIRTETGNKDGFFPATRGLDSLNEHVCDYVFSYADGTEEQAEIRRRHQIGAFSSMWGENCFQAVSCHKPRPLPGMPWETVRNDRWGFTQTFADAGDASRQWFNWLWAWKNPHPEKEITGMRLEHIQGAVLLFGISAGRTSSQPLRWRSRRKLVLTVPDDQEINLYLDEKGLIKPIQLDLGQVISAETRLVYPNSNWEETYNNKRPASSPKEIIIEYTAHPEAIVHLPHGEAVPLSRLEGDKQLERLEVITRADKTVILRAVQKETGKPVPVKLHIHGESGEYLTPQDRPRISNTSWFQDWAVDYSHGMFGQLGDPANAPHHGTYISGESSIKLPLGKIFLEISKGFEMRPIRKTIEVTGATDEITIELEKTLPWREKGWVSADTHVHFLSPSSALLEGAAEGVNVVNLLASQWGELMTNVGDFDGRTVFGTRESGGDGEYLVRVGTENRQHVLGHISLLGYDGNIILPLCSGGPDEAALGDPIEILLTEWAARCKQQNGVVILPHFPNPRCEHAASIITGNVDGIEMTSWGNLYTGISPYSLSDWYRYLNCGYLTAAVGGTDKMNSSTAVGTVRTYAKVDTEQEFTFEAWKKAVCSANTFVTYGPLLEFSVDGKTMGSRIKMSSTGGTVDVSWKAASVTVPMSRVDLVVNGEIRESRELRPDEDEGRWQIRLDKSSWLALLIRGHYADKPEIIAAHSSPVMVEVQDSPFMAAADALTILEQIEGALAYIDTVGTRADDAAYKRMRMVLTSAHRQLHNRMHQEGRFHEHTPVEDHPEHH